MSENYATVVAALVGVAGTVCGSLLTQRSNSRDRRMELESRKVEAEIQQPAAADERNEAAQAARQAERRSLYAELNSAARTCRVFAQDYAKRLASTNSDAVLLRENLPDKLTAARDVYRDLHAKAQMVVGERGLKAASMTTLCFGRAYDLLHECTSIADDQPDLRKEAAINALAWIDGPVGDTVWLRRQSLREELGQLSL